MGHYVTAYCETHGEVDMDDGRAFCEDCYEVTPKGALAEARAEIERLGGVVSMYTDVLIAKDTSIAELEADVVWAVQHGASEGYDGNSLPCIWYSAKRLIHSETFGRSVEVACERDLEIDGTPADILRAVREARKQ